MKKLRQIKAVYETVGNYGNEKSITSSNDIHEIFKFLENETKEHFYCVHLDTKNKTLAVDLVSMGSLSTSIVHPREVFKAALLSSAARVVLVHNHPSGNTIPSAEDHATTKRLKNAGELLGIEVLDHIIIGNDSFFSFLDTGNL